METKKEELYWLWLCSVPGLYARQIRTLLEHFKTPEEIYRAPGSAFAEWKDRVWVKKLLEFQREREPEEISHRLARQGIHFISRQQPDFPEKLRQLPDCPAGLFFRGKLPCTDKTAVAVVGARQCSHYGRTAAGELGAALAKEGIQVISGLALGIDGTAQQAACEAGGESYGVLGCGPDICYPRENFRIYGKVLERGGILSEFPPGTPPLRLHFPMRNRIISGLADAVVVVEARERSGSLITADLALEQGRDVYAVPGRMTDVLSQGCNRMIEEGAGILTSVEGLLENLNPGRERTKERIKEKLSLAPEEELVYSNLDLLPKGLEEIAAGTALPVGRLAGILVRLQLAGLVTEVSKNQYAKSK